MPGLFCESLEEIAPNHPLSKASKWGLPIAGDTLPATCQSIWAKTCGRSKCFRGCRRHLDLQEGVGDAANVVLGHEATHE